MDVLSTIAGLVLAVLGARLLVDGGTAVAKRFGIPSLVIGATVVAFGTSMPELTVNVHSAMGGNTDLALGNILGSNMFNIAFILGVVALISPLAVNPDSAAKDLPMCLISAIAIGVAVSELEGKTHRVDPDSGSTLTVSNRDFQSNCWVNWKLMGQPCEFQVWARTERRRSSSELLCGCASPAVDLTCLL